MSGTSNNQKIAKSLLSCIETINDQLKSKDDFKLLSNKSFEMKSLISLISDEQTAGKETHLLKQNQRAFDTLLVDFFLATEKPGITTELLARKLDFIATNVIPNLLVAVNDFETALIKDLVKTSPVSSMDASVFASQGVTNPDPERSSGLTPC